MTQTLNTVSKSMSYDHPAYTARQSFAFVRPAGANGVSAKYVAHANLVAYALSAYTQVIGNATSSYTFSGANGSATVAAVADQLTLVVVTNTASNGSTVGLSTTSYGPYTVTGNFVSGGTLTNQVGQFSQVQLNTNTGTGGLGGIVIPQGSMFYIQGGTDTAAVESVTLDYNLQPLTAVPA